MGSEMCIRDRIERGVREPTLRVLRKLTSFYGVEIEGFFVREKKVRYLVEEGREAKLLRYFRRLSSESQEVVIKFCKFLVQEEG